MFTLSSVDTRHLLELEEILVSEQGTIDAMIILARCGLGERPFAHLLSLYDGPLADWQVDEFSESLADLLDAVDELVSEGYTDEWEHALEDRFVYLLRAARALEARADDADV